MTSTSSWGVRSGRALLAAAFLVWLAYWLGQREGAKREMSWRSDAGFAAMALASGLVFGLAFGPVQLGAFAFSIYTQILGLFLLALGTSFIGLDALTTLYLRFDKARCRRLQRFYDYDVAVPLSALAVLAGTALSAKFVLDWIHGGFKIVHLSHGLVAGLGFALLGSQLFLYTLVVTLFRFGRSPDDFT